jgi:hypothetical protein
MQMQYLDRAMMKDANWVASLVSINPKKTCLTTGLLHYWALNNPQHLKPDSSEYTNTISDYKYLTDACDRAHHLGLIPFHLFGGYDCLSDSQNVFVPECSCHLRHWSVVFKQMFGRFCTSYVRCMAAKLNPVHIEIWLENSMAASLVSPIANKYNVNLIVSYRSIPTAVIFQFVRRISQSRRPIRVLHLSDFDPTGVNHPSRTREKLDMLVDHFHLANKLNLEMRHLMLSADQCQAFGLPTDPYGDNSKNPKTELLAIEAAEPGYIAATLEQNLKRYIDLSAIKKTIADKQNALQKIMPQFNSIIDILPSKPMELE